MSCGSRRAKKKTNRRRRKAKRAASRAALHAPEICHPSNAARLQKRQLVPDGKKIVLFGRRQNSHRFFINQLRLNSLHQNIWLHARVRESEAVRTFISLQL